MDADLEKQITEALTEGHLPCPVAFLIAKKANVSPEAVGEKADDLGVRIVDCQLGCFGVKKATHEDLVGVPLDEGVAKSIRESLTSGMLPCAAAYEVARQFKVSRKHVGDTATQLKIRVVNCQLGCF